MTIVGGLVARRIRHVLLLLAALMAVAAAVALFTNMEIAGLRALRPRPLGMTQIGDWDGFAHPSRVSGLLAVGFIAVGLTLLPPVLGGAPGASMSPALVGTPSGSAFAISSGSRRRRSRRSDRWYKLARTLIYGRLEDETRFTSVRRLVQYEHHMLHLMKECGIPSAQPYGVVEITPEREYLLVSEFLRDAVEISDADVTDEMIDEALSIVAQLWRSGLAHRDIKPANLMVQDGHVRVIDVAFGQIRPSPWRQAVDLSNMMLVLALQSTPEHVYERACQQFSPDEIAEAFAATRGVTLPTALRSDVRRDGRSLIERFRELAPSRRRVPIQRWTWRRIGLTAWVGLLVTLAAALFLGSLDTIGLTPTAQAPEGTIRPPYCDQAGSDLIVAQSVPTAETVPCLVSLPAGWSVSTTSVNQDRTIVQFESDRAGPGAAVLHFDETCDLSGAASVPSDDPRIDRYDRVDSVDPNYTASWYSVVEGACWW